MKIKSFLLPLLLLTACQAPLMPLPSLPFSPESAVVIPITLSCEPLPGETRSMYAESELTRIHDAQYYLFRDGALIRQQYFSDASRFAVTLPSAEDPYQLYILANAGSQPIPSQTPESSLGSAVHIDASLSGGFPMCTSIQDFTATSPSHYLLKRLVQTLQVRMDTDALQKSQLRFTGLRVRQAAADLYPFAQQSKATAVREGDSACLDDITRLNAGETVTLYLPENMRGNLLPGGSSWKDKIPSNIAASGESALASFIEILAEMDTPTAHYGEIIYRAYLGTGPCNFDVRRSSVFTLDNVFTQEMVTDEGWRVEPDDPFLTGELRFVDTRYLEDNGADTACQDVEEFYLMKGFSSVFYVYQSNPDIEFTLSASSGTVDWETARVDDHFTAVRFRTQKDFITNQGHYNADLGSTTLTSDVVFSLRSTDGLLTDQLTCKVLYLPFGISFAYQTDGTLRMKMFNPMHLRIYPHLYGAAQGSVTYKPNGTWGRSETKDVSVDIENDAPETALGLGIFPDKEGARIDRQRYQEGSLNWSDGFIEYFQEIWNTTGWDSYTALNGSNGYYKHAHPTVLWLAVDLKYSTASPLHLLPDPDAVIPVWYEQELPIRDDTQNIVIGAGTDWGFEWDGYRFDISTYKPQGETGYVNGNTMVEGTYQVPVHVNINGRDDRRLIWLPLSGTFFGMGLYAGVDDWK